VVDASVVAKWFNSGEEFENEAIALRNAWTEDRIELVAPRLLPFEVANSIWRNPNLNMEEARALARLVIKLSPKLTGLTEEVAELAMSLARRKHLPFYDASYLALARSLSRPLITADREQLEAARRFAEAIHVSSFGEFGA